MTDKLISKRKANGKTNGYIKKEIERLNKKFSSSQNLLNFRRSAKPDVKTRKNMKLMQRESISRNSCKENQ